MHKIDPTVENLLKTLATVNPNITTLYVNINNIVGNDNIIANNNVVEAAMDIVKDKYEIAKDWIIANPPFAKENKSIYYTRYKQANPNAIITNIFGKFVKNAGYNSIQEQLIDIRLNHWIINILWIFYLLASKLIIHSALISYFLIYPTMLPTDQPTNQPTSQPTNR